MRGSVNSTPTTSNTRSRTPGEPLVSVIIPTFNRADVVQNAIASVLRQTYSSLELIVVDDASTDNTEAVVRRISDTRVRYVRLPTNTRGAEARNAGLDVAKGDYVAFLDSDDVWSPYKLERQLDSVGETATRTSSWVGYTQLVADNGLERHIRPRRGKRPEELVAEYLFCGDGVTSTCTLLLPLELANRTRFRPTHPDWDLCMRLGAIGAEFVFREEALTMCDDSFHDRLSSGYQAGESLRWLQSNSDLISEKARRAYLAKHLTRPLRLGGQRGLALRYIVQALATNSISVRTGLEQVVIALITDRVHRALWRVRHAVTGAVTGSLTRTQRRGTPTRP